MAIACLFLVLSAGFYHPGFTGDSFVWLACFTSIDATVIFMLEATQESTANLVSVVVLCAKVCTADGCNAVTGEKIKKIFDQL